jgi:hypothetical protein
MRANDMSTCSPLKEKEIISRKMFTHAKKIFSNKGPMAICPSVVIVCAPPGGTQYGEKNRKETGKKLLHIFRIAHINSHRAILQGIVTVKIPCRNSTKKLFLTINKFNPFGYQCFLRTSVNHQGLKM